ncbi:hypothetical protein OIU84_026316 [Salix udensis]|uniref:DUF4283 domain-containing protein n=1 Tax=Salix udensis TaxID=889485 RepID=A0AAD6PEK7_9ROSI|nr:hypothetical protein OIU84_026316 [Salix udensis]
MSHRMVNTIASRVWRSCGLENVTTMSNGFMLFRFKTEAEMQDVMERGPWLFSGKAIVLQQWHSGFKFDKNKISKLPVWIRLHGLPFPLWSQEGLSLAASMVGRLLSCDAHTYNCQMLEYARLCVEIDATLPKVTSFEVVSPLSFEPITVEVEYEWLPSHCASCKTYGHSCKRSNKPAPTNDELHLTMAPSQHDSTTVGKIVRSKEIPSLIGTESKFTALVKFGHGMEECHSSKPDSLSSRTLLHTTTDETGDESSASAMPEQDHDRSPTISPKDGIRWNTESLASIVLLNGLHVKLLPWLLVAPSESPLFMPDQKIGGDTRWLSHHEDFQKALHQAQLFSLPYRGMNFTWTNGQIGQRNIQNKLDWALGNSCLLQELLASMANFLPRSISDHSAIILHLSKPSSVRPNQFKFLNAWTHKDDYLPLISSTWQLPTDGNPIGVC